MPTFTVAVAFLIVLRMGAQVALEWLNRREAMRHEAAPPAAVGALMDSGTYLRSVRYTLSKSRFASFEAVYDAAVLAIVLFSGLLPWWWARFDTVAPGAAWSGAMFLSTTAVVLSLPGLPLDWWAQFRLEARFGFNTSSVKLWVTDKIKGLALGLAIGFPLAWALLALVGWTGPAWWIWGFFLIFAFQLLMIVLYPKLILPLFNKLQPLPEGDRRRRLLELADRTGFHARTIEVMDGSKRSAHSNAFFTGFGRFRRIVLFDTLLDQLGQDELEAVLAHEIGHYKRGHIPQRLATAALMQAGAFALIAWLAEAPWFNASFGLPSGSLAPAFLLFALLGGLVTFWLSPAGNWISRRHEYQADAFARTAMGSPRPLVSALHKLAQKNLSNLTPHPLFSAVYYSHPTITERERALISP